MTPSITGPRVEAQSRLALAEREFSAAMGSYASPEAIKRASDELRDARWEAADDEGRARILETRAAEKDEEAERYQDMAADHAGLAAGRRLKGCDDEMVRYHDRSELACTKLAAAALEEAFQLRLRAAALFGPTRYSDLADTVREIAARAA